MIWRAVLLLLAVIGLSLALTYTFGTEILLALGLIATQAKIISKKAMQIELTGLLAWLKTEARLFFRVELFKKWVYSTVLPLVVGNAVLRKISRWASAYLDAVRARYATMIDWYRGLGTVEKVLATLIVLFATLSLTITSLGLWLILFTVQLPFWLIAGVAALGKMIWLSLRKSIFKTLAFLQLSLGWRWLRRFVPRTMLEKKRRLDFRLARQVVRRRRITLRNLSRTSTRLSLRLSALKDRVIGSRKESASLERSSSTRVPAEGTAEE